MRSKRYRFWSHDNRIRLMLTLGVAVLLPAAALIYVNYHHLKSIERDKKVEAIIHRDFQYVLAASEKRINQKAYTMTEEVRNLFPSPDSDTEQDKGSKLDLILSKNPWVAHVFLFDHDKDFIFRSQSQQLADKEFCEERDVMAETFRGWFGMEGKTLVEGMHKKTRPFYWYTRRGKRAGSEMYFTTAFFVLPNVSKDRVAIGGVILDPNYLKQTFFPGVLDELITENPTEEKGERLAMMVYPADDEGEREDEPFVASAGWSKGKP
ncbi:MAG: hypothetical protein ND895_22210, partial [Pyrinomonadaceae bacterium]|nr:hypothetical protein [Pyrinomonadaceae bacterium]